MPTTIAIIGAGAMGSAVGHRLTQHGARVLTLADGRSAKTVARIRDAGMEPVVIDEIAAADLILSIVPPAEAIGVAELLSPKLRDAKTKSAFIDFNAINPATMQQITSTLAGTGWDVLDGAIIGSPPTAESTGPKFYVSGDQARHSSLLEKHGLNLRLMEAPVGAASALKMVYAGLNKGLVGLGATMLLAAAGSGSAESLRGEMNDSLPELLLRFQKSIPDMYPKAYRWVAEMHEIAEFLGPDDPGSALFKAMADVFARIAADQNADGQLAAILNGVLENPA
ncbi:NAD(P)-dependent oxidoreductase [Phyllobacterium myrsinacearum]|uniref:3-hydroxyisobutyrate dehydrogenase-like beta-hydroxyacid dehydrogenase n=1 Tax=Phyllobacterium myrsinacearum TaxID=28101 RepID=A0A839EHH1_9HYPH|nr:NAD(P)-dependent oxidoreductase [Phyllobacterium myrsinacearum]MBA8879723.1 3-hydroxyisobutyrate dehydrogenase-like beta-hydroxyacid dehydrogenase [Phyllobacterium myrsinacearum]